MADYSKVSTNPRWRIVLGDDGLLRPAPFGPGAEVRQPHFRGHAKRAPYTDRGQPDATARGHILSKDISRRQFQGLGRPVRCASRVTHRHKVRIAWMATVQ